MAITKASSNAVAPAAKGDLVAGTTTNDSGVLAVGANGTVLTAASGQATGLEWATPSSGGMTLLSTTSLTGSSVTVSSISQSYINLQIVVEDMYSSVNEAEVSFRFQADATANRHKEITTLSNSNDFSFNATSVRFFYGVSNNSSYKKMGIINIPNYANTTNLKFGIVNSTGFSAFSATNSTSNWFYAAYNQAVAISSFSIFPSSGNFSGGTVKVYGVK